MSLNQIIYEEKKKGETQKLTIAKRNDLIQQLRFNLSRNEQLCVLYAISKIKPTDSFNQEYVLSVRDFQELLNEETDGKNHAYIKTILKNIRDKSAWVTSADGKVESVVSWFGSVKIVKDSGEVKIKFHEDLQPFLTELHRQYEEKGICYTTYSLMMVIKMKSKYGIRLYELIKSYSNNPRWTFETEKLKELMCAFDKDGRAIIPKTWSDFNHFKNKVIEPAIADINNSSDLHIGYDTVCQGRKVVQVTFFFARKTEEELQKIFAGSLPSFMLNECGKNNDDGFLSLVANDKETQFRQEHPFFPQY